MAPAAVRVACGVCHCGNRVRALPPVARTCVQGKLDDQLEIMKLLVDPAHNAGMHVDAESVLFQVGLGCPVGLLLRRRPRADG